MSNEDFIIKSNNVHNNKYDYSKTKYNGANNKVTIICPKHGEFEQRASSHISGKGCPKCGLERRTKTTEQFIEKARKVHGDKYDYSKVDYKNQKTEVTIICPIHGEFKQRASSHLSGCGCYECGKHLISEKAITPDYKLLQQFNEIHNKKYKYDISTFVNCKHKMKIICPKHGEFWQTPSNHLKGYGCSKCAIECRAKKRKKTTEQFIEEAKKVHGDKYDYSKSIYTYSTNKIRIICPKHGEFEQTASEHLRGVGCPHCNMSKLETEVNDFLVKNKIKFERQKRFEWLGKKSLDFYLPTFNVAIECQGEQHYNPVKFGGKKQIDAEEIFKKQIKRDRIKKTLCEENGVKILYFSHCKDSSVIKNTTDLLITIKNNV